jgi:WD40 repeat protein
MAFTCAGVGRVNHANKQAFSNLLVSWKWLLGAALAATAAACAANVDDSEPGVITAALSRAPDIRWSVSSAGGPVAFSPDGNSVATGSTQAVVQLLSTANGAQTKTFRIRATANAVAFSRDGSLLATGSSSGPLNLRLFRVADGSQVFREKAAHENGTTSVAFSPVDSALFATGGRDKRTSNTKLWDTAGNIVRSLDDGARVFALAFAPDGKTLASNASGTIHIWRVSDGALLRSIETVNQSALAFSPDGRFLTTGFELFDAASGALIRSLPWPTGGDVSSVTFTKDGSAVVAGGEDFPNDVDVATIRYFRVSDGATLTVFNNVGGMNAYVKSVAISPDGKLLTYGVATDHVTALATSPF